jgi:hypothetical protein
VRQFSENNYEGPPDPYRPDPSTITPASGGAWGVYGGSSSSGGGSTGGSGGSSSGISSSDRTLWEQFDPNPTNRDEACAELEQIATEQCEGDGLVLGGFVCFSETYGSAYCQTSFEQRGCLMDHQLVAQYQETEGEDYDPEKDPQVWVCPD